MDLLKTLEHQSLKEIYFITISLILAFGVLQTTGTVLSTDKPVVSVVSCSMYPQLHVGDVLVVQGQNYDNIQEGDVIVYSVKKATIEVDGQQVTLNPYSDSPKKFTNVGEMELLNVFTNSNGQPIQAVVKIDNKRYQLTKGFSYEINGETVTVTDLEGMSIPIVHRVSEKNENYLQTMGDNNNAQLEFEKNVTPSQIHGKVQFLVPRIGGVKLLAMDMLGYSGDQPFVIDTYPRCTARN